MEHQALLLYLDNEELLRLLSDRDRGKLLLALMDYVKTGARPEFRGALLIAFTAVRASVDRAMLKWAQVSRSRSEAGKKSAAVRAALKSTEEVSCKAEIEEESSSGEQESTNFNKAEQASTNSTIPVPVPKPVPEPKPEPIPVPKPVPVPDPKNPAEARKHPKAPPPPEASGTRTWAEKDQAACEEENLGACAEKNQGACAGETHGVWERELRASPPQEGDFARFWEAYPRKTGKTSAKAAFDRVKVPLDTLLRALEQQRGSPQWQREGGRYIPYPATWLNQARWEDESPQDPKAAAVAWLCQGVETL